LLPEWVRWNGEQARIPDDLIERAVAAASGQPVLQPLKPMPQ
jgi:hypothetical protein